MREAIERETPDALNWSTPNLLVTVAELENLMTANTHDSITVSWDVPAAGREYIISVRHTNGSVWKIIQPTTAGRQTKIIDGLPFDTGFYLTVTDSTTAESQHVKDSLQISTKPAPAGAVPLPTGPKNLRATSTHDAITATWELPHPAALSEFRVALNYAGTSQWAIFPYIIQDATSHTIGDFLPDTLYDLEITHNGVVLEAVTIQVRTKPLPSDAVGGRQDVVSTEDVRPPMPGVRSVGAVDWPFEYNDIWWITGDPWVWRTTTAPPRFHAGLDAGINATTPVYAAVDGIAVAVPLKVSAKHQYVLYCPTSILGRIHGISLLPLHRQILLGARDETERKDKGKLTCIYIVSPASGRTVLVFHGPNGDGPLVSKYSHLNTIDASIQPIADRSVISEVKRGDPIGTVGGSRDGKDYRELGEKPNVHLHFELRYLNGWISDKMYSDDSSVIRCVPSISDKGIPVFNARNRGYCDGGEARWMASVLDPELHLPPLPTPIGSVPEKRAFTVTNVSAIQSASESQLAVSFDYASEIPKFYMFTKNIGEGDGGRRDDHARPSGGRGVAAGAAGAVRRCARGDHGRGAGDGFVGIGGSGDGGGVGALDGGGCAGGDGAWLDAVAESAGEQGLVR